jgi:DNA-binding NtrC family response regulator
VRLYINWWLLGRQGGWVNLKHVSALIEDASGKERSNVPSATTGEPAAARPDRGVLVYVVDDEPMVGELVATVLEMDGFQFKLFIHPSEALEAFIAANPRPALLLTDFVMPGFNGMELIEHCKRVQPTLKTILYSGNVGAEVIQRYQVKPDFFIRKPFHSKNLMETVRLVLAR